MTAPSLREVQRWMKSRIRSQAPWDGAAHGTPGGYPTGQASGAATAGAVRLNAQRGMPGEARLSVYAGGYVARIRESLAETYDAVRHLLGEAAFAELAAAYAARHPSQDYNLSFAGRHLPEFLAGWPGTPALPFLPDLARLEWRIAQAFHAFEQPPLNPAELTRRPLEAWTGARIVFQPSVSVVASAWPILDLWAARAVPREQIDIAVANRPQRALVYRQGVTTRCEPISAAPGRLLEGLLAGEPLGEALERVEHAPAPVGDWFARWAGQGLIVRCE